jgi:hypothetical protein
MEKVSITINLAKIDKSRIVERTYTNQAGEQVTEKNYKMDVVPMKPENFKTIANGDTWELVKKYFVTASPTKEERSAQTQTQFLGDGVVMQNTETPPTARDNAVAPAQQVPAGEQPAVAEGDIPW